MPGAGTIAALVIVGASAMYGLVLVGFAKARRRLPLSWFAVSCVMLGAYSMAMVTVTVPGAPDAIIGWIGSAGYFAASLFTLSANRYAYYRAGLPMTRMSRCLEAALILAAFVVFLPGVAYDQGSIRQWEALQTTYRFPDSTAVLGVCALAIFLGLVNLIRVAWANLPSSILIGCVCLLVAGAHDILISLYVYESAFAAAVGALVFLVTTALDEAVQWGDEARQLSNLKATLEQRVRERTEELSDTLVKLSRSERLAALGQMSAAIGHEINNPLTYVMMNLEMLRDKSSPNDAELMEHAFEGAQRIAGIVAQLRVLSKPASQRKDVVDIDETMRTAIRTIEHKTTKFKTLHLDSVPETAFVLGDRQRVIQLFINLLTNSLESLKDDGIHREVRISVAANDQSVIVSVADQGIGISDEIRERLFEPFSTGRSDGMGIGLAVAQTVVDELGGTISVDSRIGKGSVFTITLPATRQQPVKNPPAATPAPKVEDAQVVLIVDDESLLVECFARLLPGCNVTVCSNGNDAIEMMRCRDFEVVFCDLVMPGISGFEVCSRVIEENPDYEGRFVLMSGGIPSEDLRKQLATRNVPYLSKPFRVKQMREMIADRLHDTCGNRNSQH